MVGNGEFQIKYVDQAYCVAAFPAKSDQRYTFVAFNRWPGAQTTNLSFSVMSKLSCRMTTLTMEIFAVERNASKGSQLRAIGVSTEAFEQDSKLSLGLEETQIVNYLVMSF